MSNLVKCHYEALCLDGNNYFEWALETTLHLRSQNLGEVIKEKNTSSLQDKSKATIFIRHHICSGLRAEYLDIEDPFDLWKRLKDRFEHMKSIALPQALNEWSNLRLQDFKSINEYNSAVFRIVSKLRMCGENITDALMLEKTFSTFHPSNMLLQQQYRERKFEKFTDLIACLLIAEQNNELLLKNHHTRPVGSAPFPEVNMTSRHNTSRFGRGRGPSRGRGRGRGRGHNNFQARGRNDRIFHQQWNRQEGHERRRGNSLRNETPRNIESKCYRCGGTGHWARTCRTPKHLVDLYQASIKDKGKEKVVETNYIDNTENKDLTNLNIFDFLGDDDGEIGQMSKDVVETLND